MKKILVVIICVVLALLLYVTCNNGTKEHRFGDDEIDNDIAINNLDGTVYAFENYRAVNRYIKIEKNRRYRLLLKNSGGGVTYSYNAVLGAYYNQKKKFISGFFVYRDIQKGAKIDNGSFLLDIPSGCKYIKLSVNDNCNNRNWFLISEKGRETWTNETQKIVWLGDSIVGIPIDESSVTEVLSSMTGTMVYNIGFGGCRMSMHEEGWDNCSAYNLAKDIYSNDYAALLNSTERGWDGMPEDFRYKARTLAKDIDFDSVSAVIISFGTNDYTAPSSKLDNPENPYDVSCVCGALRKSILLIRRKNPNIKIFVTSPIYRYFKDENEGSILYDSNTKDFGSGTLQDYSGAYRNVCKEMHAVFIDLYNESGINFKTREQFFTDDDTTHPNKKGRNQIARIVAGYIK